MPRPTLLIAEPEPANALSARKLVMETAKFNVITAHSGGETLDLLQKFPNSDAVIVHSELPEAKAEDIFAKVRAMDLKMPIILLMSGVERSRKDADYVLPSDEPEALLHLLRDLLGDPR
jgi:response regulator RpfG family c-di-GMP phosphodiesterase